MRDMNAPIEDLIDIADRWIGTVLADRWEEMTFDQIRAVLVSSHRIHFLCALQGRFDYQTALARLSDVIIEKSVPFTIERLLAFKFDLSVPLTDNMVRVILRLPDGVPRWYRPHHFTDDQLAILASTPLGAAWLETNVGLLGLLQ